jgi:hypothetical protein
MVGRAGKKQSSHGKEHDRRVLGLLLERIDVASEGKGR